MRKENVNSTKVDGATPARITYDKLPALQQLFERLKHALHNYERAMVAQSAVADDESLALIERIVNQAEMLMKYAGQVKDQRHSQTIAIDKLISLVDLPRTCLEGGGETSVRFRARLNDDEKS